MLRLKVYNIYQMGTPVKLKIGRWWSMRYQLPQSLKFGYCTRAGEYRVGRTRRPHNLLLTYFPILFRAIVFVSVDKNKSCKRQQQKRFTTKSVIQQKDYNTKPNSQIF